MFRPDLLINKKALVTGGGSGLGRSISKRYLELGAKVVICGRRVEVLQATVAELKESTGGDISFIPCNIRDPEAVIAMIDEIWREGPLDILVNNAAANFIGTYRSAIPPRDQCDSRNCPARCVLLHHQCRKAVDR